MKGQDVDWYAAIKIPANIDKWQGRGFVYLDSFQTDWKLSPLPINSTSSAVGATLKQLYMKDKELLKIAYNDDWPDTHKANNGRGHSKGVAVANREGGFWLIHSVPNFPPIKKYEYPESGTKFAQSLLCISFGVDALPAVSQYMRFAQVTPYVTALPPSIKFLAPYFEDVIHKKSLSRSDTKFTYSQTIYTHDRTNVTIFSKHKKFNKDLWYGLIAPSLRTPLCVETWRNGAAQDVGTQCGGGENVYDVTEVRLPQATFSSTKDHSKWGVSMNESAPFVCIGDVNRQISQFNRGGGAACVQNKALWAAFYRSVATFAKCNVEGKETEVERRKMLDHL
ncbi:Deoxyribonuclease II [Parelaphostrongylus tenuis]|uniref:Deoxyribonuclease II n=1 Tax=Parelaphostrongylus tenuis TaxID=148309 RepID=A0AAD5LWS5_PARTN|nr:Deoxyribonuclease II [Parelaphostrongylus tenuis]